MTVFTDGSSSGLSGFYSSQGSLVQQTCHASARRAETQALCMAQNQFPSQPLNIYSDSQYIAGVATVIETAILGNINSEKLFHLFQAL